MSEAYRDDELEHVLRYVLRRPGNWAARDAERFREQLEQLIGDLAGELDGFQVYDDFGYERDLPCDVQKAIADAVTKKWQPYPGHMHKIEEICQGVIYCLRLKLLKRAEQKAEGRSEVEDDGGRMLWEPPSPDNSGETRADSP